MGQAPCCSESEGPLPSLLQSTYSQIGMQPPLHCASTFSTCLWFTNFTKIRGAPTLDPELWTYSKQFYYEAGLPKLHQKHGCEKTEANYLDWQGMGGGSSGEEPSGNQIPQQFDFFSHHPWRAPGSAFRMWGCRWKPKWLPSRCPTWGRRQLPWRGIRIRTQGRGLSVQEHCDHNMDGW